MERGIVQRDVTRPASDDGVVVIFVAICMTLLLVLVALAVDLGIGFNERRKSQNTVDAGTLAGGRLLLVAKTPPGVMPPEADIADEIIRITHANLVADTAFSDASGISLSDWTARFAGCADSDRDVSAFPVVSGRSACISYNAAMTRVRVRMPNVRMRTFFARVVGIDALTVHAVAEAELVPDGGGGLLPFGLPGSSAGDTEVCLKSGSQPELPPCDGPVEGNFGSLDVAFYGNGVMGTPEMCTGGTNLRLAANIAAGVDHPMDEYREAGEETEEIRDDRAWCPELAARPNQVLGQTGIGSNLDIGLLEGTSLDGHPVPGRLTRGPWATRTVRIGTAPIDDEPLWQFIDPALAEPTIPASCLRSGITSRAQMATCLTDYRTGGFTAPLFTQDADADGHADILRSPRLAFVPELHQAELGPGTSNPYQIKAFRVVFLQTLYFACSAGPGGCAGVFDPGEAGTALPVSGNRRVEALTSFLLTDSMVPTEVLERGPAGVREYTLLLRR